MHTPAVAEEHLESDRKTRYSRRDKSCQGWRELVVSESNESLRCEMGWIGRALAIVKAIASLIPSRNSCRRRYDGEKIVSLFAVRFSVVHVLTTEAITIWLPDPGCDGKVERTNELSTNLMVRSEITKSTLLITMKDIPLKTIYVMRKNFAFLYFMYAIYD